MAQIDTEVSSIPIVSCVAPWVLIFLWEVLTIGLWNFVFDYDPLSYLLFPHRGLLFL